MNKPPNPIIPNQKSDEYQGECYLTSKIRNIQIDAGVFETYNDDCPIPIIIKEKVTAFNYNYNCDDSYTICEIKL